MGRLKGFRPVPAAAAGPRATRETSTSMKGDEDSGKQTWTETGMMGSTVTRETSTSMNEGKQVWRETNMGDKHEQRQRSGSAAAEKMLIHGLRSTVRTPYRRKFRSLTSDLWKDATSPMREQRVRWQKITAVRRKKIWAREMLGKSRNDVFFNGWCVRMARKVGSSGVRGALWRKDWQKLARRLGAKHIGKSKVAKHLMLGAVLEMQLGKLARRLGAKHISKSKVAKHLMPWAVLEDATSKIGTPPRPEAHLEVKSVKAHHIRTTFGRSDRYMDRQKDRSIDCQTDR